MFEIDAIASSLGFLLNDFCRHLRGKAHIEVFLCGPSPENPYVDLRSQVKHLLESRMGCRATRGEDIEDLKGDIHPDKNHLTIEVKQAKTSDLVIIFLGSAGTIAEVTAFALDPHVNQKVVVFNRAEYEGTASFLNYGPLRLLDKEQLIYYETGKSALTAKLVLHLDLLVAAAWLRKRGSEVARTYAYEALTLMMIQACFPMGYADLAARFPHGDGPLRTALKILVAQGRIRKQGERWVPACAQGDSALTPGALRDVARVRLSLMNRRLRSELPQA